MDGLFRDLEDETKFIAMVGDHYAQVPFEINASMQCKQTIDIDRLRYSYREYMQNIGKFALYLHSSNPDHAKRAGALLHALYKSEIVTNLELEFPAEEIEFDGGLTRLSNLDAAQLQPFLVFWEQYHNQALAFDFAYGCCASYEKTPRAYNFEYLHNVCRYLHENTDLSIDSCFMLFKSLMA